MADAIVCSAQPNDNDSGTDEEFDEEVKVMKP